MTRGQLIELALGTEEARKVDTSIPQNVFDGMTQFARNDVAGWYYSEESRVFGRLLTQSECWAQITWKLREGKLAAHFGSENTNIGYTVANWPCLRQHAERGEIIIQLP